MAFISEFFQDMLYFVAWTVCSFFISCAGANEDIQLTKLAYDDDDEWWRKFYTTEDPDFWWRKFTLEPVEDRNNYLSNNHFYTSFIIFLVIFIFGVVFLCIGVFYCMKYCAEGRNHRTVTTPAILTVPSAGRNVHPPPENTRARVLQTESHVATAPQLFSIFRGATNSSNTNIATDKPPGYDDVVLSDLSAPKYAEVISQAPESPPPNYDDNIKY